MPPARQIRDYIPLAFVTAFVALLAVSGLILVVSADDTVGRVFGAIQLIIGVVILSLLIPVWRGPRPPRSGPLA